MSQTAPNLSARYKSPSTLFGIPIGSIAYGPDLQSGERYGHAKGIIAGGDVATGFVAAGAIAQGFFSAGAVALGRLAAGGVAIGGISSGGEAIGFNVGGGLAIGIKSRVGALAILCSGFSRLT
jgi:hypothetical protein